MNKVTFKKVDQSTYLVHIQQDMDFEVRISPTLSHIQQQPNSVVTDRRPNKVFPLSDCCTYSDQKGIFVRQNHHYRRYLFCQISWIEASGSYSFIHLDNQNKIIVTHPLAAIENNLWKKHTGFGIHLLFQILCQIGLMVVSASKSVAFRYNLRCLLC